MVFPLKLMPRTGGWLISLGALLGVAAVVLAYPVNTAKLGFHPLSVPTPAYSEISRGPREQHRLALTFDAGGEATALPELLAALRDRRVRCTFFLTGQWTQRNFPLARQIVADGHEIGNHTWSHLDLTSLSDDQIALELARADTLLATLTGRSTKPLWRAPFGATNARVLRVAGEHGYRSIYWSLDSLDSVEPPKTSSFLIERIANQGDWKLGGAIILMHVGELVTAEAVPVILDQLQARHYHFTTVSALCGIPSPDTIPDQPGR